MTSAIPVTTQHNQYDQPRKNPAQGPRRSAAKSWKDFHCRLCSNSSPMALMTKKSIVPITRWATTMLGPEVLMDFPDPMNRPVPMAPPMAIS